MRRADTGLRRRKADPSEPNTEPSVRRAAVDLVTDIETDRTSVDHADLRLWLRMLACTHWIETEIKNRLRDQFGVTLTQFNLMAQLERARKGIKMGELSRRTMVTSSNITAVTDQLFEAGHVVRLNDPMDRRAYIIRLTPKGLAAFNRMARVHEQWVVEMLSKVPAAEKSALYDMLGRLKTSLGATLRNSL